MPSDGQLKVGASRRLKTSVPLLVALYETGFRADFLDPLGTHFAAQQEMACSVAMLMCVNHVRLAHL